MRRAASHATSLIFGTLVKTPEMRDWLFSWLIGATTMVAPRTTQANQSVSLLPLFYLFARWSSYRGSLIVVAIEVDIVVAVWSVAALALPAMHDPAYTLQQHRWISPILPVAITGVLGILSIWPRWRAMGET